MRRDAAKNNADCTLHDGRTKVRWIFMNDRQIFGAFLKSKRNEREIPIRLMAEQVGIKPGYFNDIESGRRTPIEFDLLDRIVETLKLSDEDRQTFYDLAGKAREAAPPDLTGYINESKKARVALRVAKEIATDEDWEQFTKYLEEKRKG
jgi:transcriptional regulator with XRE-family HTH domain